MHSPQNTLRLPIPDDACAYARKLLGGGAVAPDDILEFMRGDMVCLRGTVRAFASREVWINHQGTPIHRRYKAPKTAVTAPPMRLNDHTLGGEG
jgi:hypothetical protein